MWFLFGVRRTDIHIHTGFNLFPHALLVIHTTASSGSWQGEPMAGMGQVFWLASSLHPPALLSDLSSKNCAILNCTHLITSLRKYGLVFLLRINLILVKKCLRNFPWHKSLGFPQKSYLQIFPTGWMGTSSAPSGCFICSWFWRPKSHGACVDFCLCPISLLDVYLCGTEWRRPPSSDSNYFWAFSKVSFPFGLLCNT